MAWKQPDVAGPAHPLVNALSEAYFSDRYPGFDLDDADWPALRQQIESVDKLLEAVRVRVTQNR